MQRRGDVYENAWKSFAGHGDKESFDILFEGMYARYCRLAMLLLGNREDAEDVVQEVFLNLWKSRESFEYMPGVESYLYRAVKNRCLNRIRDRKGTEDLSAAEGLESRYGLESLSESEIRKVVDDALGRLPEKCRTVFILSRFANKSNRAIAGETSLSEKSVEAYITRALKSLRAAFDKF